MSRRLASGKKSTDWVFFEKRFEVPDYDNPTGGPSRTRWRILHTPFFGVYLHKWDLPDPRPTLHNHPWNFLSLILKGGYTQKTLDGVDRVRWFNFVGRKNFHAVTDVKKGTLSLMIVGKTHQDWGYQTENGYVEFDKHPHSQEFALALKKRQQFTQKSNTF